MLRCLPMDRNLWARRVLIVSLTIVFLYFGIMKFVEPSSWVGFLPSWMNGFMGFDKYLWLSVLGVLEIFLGVALLISRARVQKIVAALVALHLLFVVIQVGWNDIGIRDIGLFLSSIALFLLL